MAFESELGKPPELSRRSDAVVRPAPGQLSAMHTAIGAIWSRLTPSSTDRAGPPRSRMLGNLWRLVIIATTMVAAKLSVLLAWIGRTRVARFLTQSLMRRIIASNLLGFGILIFGLMFLSQQHSWLTEAKSKSLKEQGEIIARVIASNASIENERIAIDPDRLPEVGGSLIPFRNDAFTALELSIRPERISPLLRRLMQQTNNRARIYGRDGTLIVDTALLIGRGQVLEPPTADDGRPKTRNFWTRLTQWLKGSELSVYREIGTANGTAYPEVRDALAGKPREMLLLSQDGELIVSVTVPIQRAGAVHGALLLSTRPGEIDEIVADERGAILSVSIIALLATLAAAIMLSRTVAGPMQTLSAAAEGASNDIHAARNLPDYSDRQDEIGQMASAFRAMTEALYRRIDASEKFAADVAHELKNPLTAARSTAESLGYARTDEQRRELVKQIQSELKRLNRLITDVSNASRLDAELARQHSEPVDVVHMLGLVVSSFRDLISDTQRRIVLDVATGPAMLRDAFVVKGNEGRLAQVATNLIDNAISFSPDEGTITVRVHNDAGRVEFSVRDEGPGIEDDSLEKVFERFYTYRPTADSSRGNNSGLGLSISREIVAAHAGRIWVENAYATSADGQRRRSGAVFKVSLPAITGGKRG